MKAAILGLLVVAMDFPVVSSTFVNPIRGCKSPANITVVFQDARFTILSDMIIRMERAPFVDKCTFAFTSRDPIGTPQLFEWKVIDNKTLQINTSSIRLVYSPTSQQKRCPCVEPKQNVQPASAVRTRKFPDGLQVLNESSCCLACTNDDDCVAWEYASGNTHSDRNCWPLASFTGVEANANRTFCSEVPVLAARLGGEHKTFSPDELAITFSETGTTWRPGADDQGNLGGTISSWNEVDPSDFPDKVQPGFLSRAGWALVDDTSTPLFADTADPVKPFQGGAAFTLPYDGGRTSADWYMFGCGSAYRKCLSQAATLSGRIEMPPRVALGVWWSHFEPLSAYTMQHKVLAGYANFSLPLNVLEMDVNWHTYNPRNLKQCNGYNGFDWNQSLFPDPVGYVATVHAGNWSPSIAPAPQYPMRLILNTHNFLGIDSCQREHDAIQKQADLPENPHSVIPFNVGSYKIMTAVFDQALNRNAAGLATRNTRPDYWWTDGSLARWGSDTGDMGSKFNLFFSTHLHSSSIRFGVDPINRPVVMPRYAGLGQQRYCCGFSGDASSSWETLAMEVNMTKTAANALFGYWSHDIGGFKLPDPTAEMYARWTQFGAVSPMFRTHGTKGSTRRVWMYPSTFPQMKQAMQLRAVLHPLLYTAAHEAWASGIAMCYPMYYDWADQPAAYDAPYQYMLTPNIVARPVVQAIAADDDAVAVRVWLPPAPDSAWMFWNTSEVMSSGSSGTFTTVSASIDILPLFVRAGSVLPLLPIDTVDVSRVDAMEWALFLGLPTRSWTSARTHHAPASATVVQSGQGKYYVDDDNTTAYENGAYGEQSLTYSLSFAKKTLTCVIHAVDVYGSFVVDRTAAKHHSIQLRGVPGIPSTFNVTTGSGVSIPATAKEITEHTLAIPTGTVVVTLQQPLLLMETATVVIKWK
eukprot:m.973822 g.973822  ORF g.973822 m.973822 type:complete len:923 (-) comp23937_c0_seq4:718-3486(-)